MSLLWEIKDHPAILGQLIDEGHVTRLTRFATRHERAGAGRIIQALCAGVTALADLSLKGCFVGDDECHALATTSAFAGLQSLNLVNNNVRDAGARGLLASLPRLRYLNLYNNWLSPAGVASVTDACAGRGVELWVSCQRTGPW